MARRTVEELIQMVLDEGYRLEKFARGDYNPDLEDYRSRGYMAAAWYTDKETKTYKLFIREKKTRKVTKEVKVEPEVVEIPFETMTVKELKTYCKLGNIKGYGRMNKAQMIEELKKVG